MEQYKENEAPDNNEVSIFDDLKPIPEYYSERAVYVFSLLFSTIFGSILMAINFKNTEEKKGIWEVLLFGVFFAGIGGWILNTIHANNLGFTLAMNGGGAYIMNRYFRDKYIGRGVPYTPRSVLVPGIIGVVIAVLAVVLVLLSAEYGVK